MKNNSLNQPYEYVGREGYYRESVFNLYLLGQRWYDSEVGRFISRDPIEEKGGINLYEYVGNNLLKFTDPLGLIVVNISYYPSVQRCLNILRKCKVYFNGPINAIGNNIFYDSELKDAVGKIGFGLFDGQLKIYIGPEALKGNIVKNWDSFDEMCSTIAHELMHAYLYIKYGSVNYPDNYTADDFAERWGTDVYQSECKPKCREK